MEKDSTSCPIVVGWREWAALPDLGIAAIKVKVDTGARTSALHAFELETYMEEEVEKVKFKIHPLQRRSDVEVECEAIVVDRRIVSDSGGHREKRIVIRTPLKLGNSKWDVEFTLTDRDTMRFRALLGRTAMTGRLIVDPGMSYQTGLQVKEEYMQLMRKGK